MAEHTRNMNQEKAPEISIVVPIYNEAPNLRPLVEKVCDVMHSLGRSFELILVDDGSTDESREILQSLKEENRELRILFFRRNFGQSAAMTAGFDHARGGIVVSMDGDLQNDPENIPKMIERLEEGFDLVNGWRKDRKTDSFQDGCPPLSPTG